MKRILINALDAQELRAALVYGDKLYDLNIETLSHAQKKGNIYKGIVTQVQPSLDAVFVDYGSDRQGFLPFKEIAKEYYNYTKDSENPDIKDTPEVGQSMIVQISKEERGRKGALLTTFLSLAGPHMVLAPFKEREHSISKKISGQDRNLLKDILSSIKIPQEGGIIARTSSIGRSISELQWNVDYLTHLWKTIREISKTKNKPFLIHQEDSLIICTIRDNLREDINEVIIDDADAFKEAKKFVEMVLPAFTDRIKFYKDKTPLFTRFQIEEQAALIYQRAIPLSSGASISIDVTEALTAIDINSAKAMQGSDIEETAFQINLEACEEIARQSRLRDIGGLIIVDFIDMKKDEHNAEIENAMAKHLKGDRAQIQISEISSQFGLLTFSRQRLKLSILEKTSETCMQCQGIGYIRSTESSGTSILRQIEERYHQGKFATVSVKVPIDVAIFLTNVKKEPVQSLEDKYNIQIIIIPSQTIKRPHYELFCYDSKKQIKFSKHAAQTDINLQKYLTKTAPKPKKPAVQNIEPQAAIPTPGIFERIRLMLIKKKHSKPQKAASSTKRLRQSSNRYSSNRQRQNNRNNK